MELPQHRDQIDVLEHVLALDQLEPLVVERKRNDVQVVDDVDPWERGHIQVDPARADVRPATDVQTLHGSGPL
jgi:hypothetical protein